MATLVYNGVHFKGLGHADVSYIQVVAAKRFREGKGFSVGVFGTKNSGEVVKHFLWLHPSIPTEFIYGNESTFEIDPETVDLYLEMAETPVGIFIGNAMSRSDLPFAYPVDAK